MLKSILKVILLLFVVTFINGCVYVLGFQDKTMSKIMEGGKVTLYEKCSIYTMHMAVYMFGWTIAPEAAGEVFRMSFPWNRDRMIFKENDFFLDSPVVLNSLCGLHDGKRKYITFDGDVAYSTSDPNHRVALGVNPGYLYMRDHCCPLKMWTVNKS